MHPTKRKALDEAVRKIITAFVVPSEQIESEWVDESYPVTKRGTNKIHYHFYCENGATKVVEVTYSFEGYCTSLKKIEFK